MSVIGSNILAGASGQGGYFIDRSVRLRSSASAYFNRTPASAGNRKTWTWSGWVKRGSLTTTQWLFGAGPISTDYTIIRFGSGGSTNDFLEYVRVVSSAVDAQKISSAVYRDPSAWYHIVVAEDAANTVARIYVNGSEISYSTNDNPSNVNGAVNNTGSHEIGRYVGSAIQHFDGYLTEINFVDGQALTPSDFGEYDADTGVWKPKKYVGTYGTNGFYLNFSDNTSTTTLGYDYSGNGNNWTANNISLTSGVTYDSMTDVPTLTSETAANFAVLNRVNQTTYGSLSDGNLKLSGATDWGGFPSSIPIPKTGKWYAEFVLGSTSSNSAQVDCGIFPVGNTMYYSWSNSYGLEANNGFYLITNGSYSSNRGSTTAGGAVFQIAVDADAGKVWFGVNNAWYDTYNTTNGDPSAGTNPSGSSINFDSTTYQMAVKTDFNNWTANFGQRPFAYTPPTGFKALNTFNLPDSTIVDGSQYFDATTYSGNSSTQNIVNAGGFQPDFVWIKNRSSVLAHYLNDSVRGAYKTLFSNLTNAEYDGTSFSDGVSTFNSNGFTLLNGANVGNYNQSGDSYIGWQWKAGGTAVSNTDGSITSSVSANTTSGFSIVTGTAPASSGAFTTGHGLGVAPAMIITKIRSGTLYNWWTWHKSLSNPAQSYIGLNLTNASATDPSLWANTAPTSSVWSMTSGNYPTNSQQFVAYCFAEVPGFSKFGSYTGNGSADGPFVFCGFRPRLVMIKRTDTAGNNWVILDTARDTYNAGGLYLYPNLSAAEDDYRASTGPLDILSNGFKPRSSLSNVNASGATYIYAAFAENPFKNSLAR